MRVGSNILRLVSIAFLVSAVVLFFYQLVVYSQERSRLPAGLEVAGVPVGGLDQSAALERLLHTYGTPIELHYGQQSILLPPASVGFQLDTDGMLAAAEQVRTENDFWGGFWDHLWNRPSPSQTVPLIAEFSRSDLEAALRDVAARYDQPPLPSQPVPGTPRFDSGQSGQMLDISRAIELIAEVFQSPANRRVNLPVVSTSPTRPTLGTLETLIKQNAEAAGFNGLMVVYLHDLRSGEELHFATYQSVDFSLQPDIAFTAASIIKIPIMVAYYRYYDEPFGVEQDRWMFEMITESGNDPADWLMEDIDSNQGPLMVTETLRELGLENTFMAGFFRPGSELLRIYNTESNQRPDLSTRPDVYNQTTASEIGMLLSDIYYCSQGGGTLLAVFPEQIRPEECRKMLEILSENKIALLLEAGVPERTRVAHKHGWTNSPIDTVGDAGIIFSPGGEYVLAIFLWNNTEMIWEPTSRMFAELTRATYNFYNPPDIEASSLDDG